jgi:hypothetical protein
LEISGLSTGKTGNSLIFMPILFPYDLPKGGDNMWLFGLGIFLGIGIYWATAIILVNRVLNRHIDNEAYLPMLWSWEIPKHKQQ